MKKCPYCGREYPHGVVRCLVDNESLDEAAPAAGSEAEVVPLAIPPLLAAIIVAPRPPACLWTERQIRALELVLVCLVAFGGFIMASTYSFIFSEGRHDRSNGAYYWIYNSLVEITSLGMLGYILVRHGKSFSDLGFSWKRSDFAWSIPLWMGGTFAYYVIYNCLYYCGLTPVSRGNATAHVGHMVFGGGVFVVTFMFQFLNPFFEELLARAYVMTEIKFLTNNLPLAVIASTALQTSYHFYQGVPSAMGIGANFLLWSIFYAKTGRIVPLILAHMYEDVLATMSYATHAFLPV